MITSLLSVSIRSNRDVLVARQRARLIAALLGFADCEQSFLAAAAFELAHEIHRTAGTGTMQYAVAGKIFQIYAQRLHEKTQIKEDAHPRLVRGGLFEERDGESSQPLAEREGDKLNAEGVRRLMSYLDRKCRSRIGVLPGVQLPLPEGKPAVDREDIPWLIEQVAGQATFSLFDEIHHQNQEMLRILEEMRNASQGQVGNLTHVALEGQVDKNPAA